MTQTDLESSGEMFERAIEIDSGYGPAWACLSAAHATLYEWFGSKEEDLSLAERACRKALELSPNLAEPHAAWGFVLSLSGRYAEAAREFEEAIRFNPAFFEAYYYFARSCFAGGEIARSAELFGKAADVRQEDFQSAMLQGQSLRQLGRMEESRVATREGVRRAERILMLNPTDARALSLGSGALFEDGQVERAFEWCQRALELHPEDMTTLTSAACLYAKAGQKEKSLMYLERVLARGWGKRDWIAQDSDYDILRDDPRFKKLLSTLK
jgi:tetratricopeptide (TPR) repeat protein